MAKQTYYFSHDYNARSDRKIVHLLMKYGVEAVGIYWCIVEMLYEEGGYLHKTECERIAFELRTDCERISNVVNSLLFKSDEDKFWSESVLERLKIRTEKSKSAAESANKRWEKEKSMRTHSDGNAIKENKGKEILSLNNNNKVKIGENENSKFSWNPQLQGEQVMAARFKEHNKNK